MVGECENAVVEKHLVTLYLIWCIKNEVNQLLAKGKDVLLFSFVLHITVLPMCSTILPIRDAHSYRVSLILDFWMKV